MSVSAILFTGDVVIDEYGNEWCVVDRNGMCAELFRDAGGGVTRWVPYDPDGPPGTYFLAKGWTVSEDKREAPLKPRCTCGASKTMGAIAAHSSWCDILPDAPAPWSNSTRRLF